MTLSLLPLSRIPAVGRNPIYIATFVIFVILQVPTALVDNFAGLLVLRCLSGFFGSPCLATGAATFQDMYPFIKIPYLLALWAGSVTMGPALAPIIAGFSVGPMGWHWFAWELLWLAAPICLLMFICLPETSTPNILFRRAQRLRKSTGRHNLKSQSQIDQADMSVSDIAFEALVKPWQINVLDPAVVSSSSFTSTIDVLIVVGFHDTLHSPRLRAVLLLFRIVSSRLSRQIPFQPRGVEPSFPCHCSRSPHLYTLILRLLLLYHRAQSQIERFRSS